MLKTQADVNRMRHLKRIRNIRRGPAVIQEHREIIAAIRQHDADSAEAALVAHIGSLEQEIQQLVKRYGALDVVKAIDLEIKSHEFVVLVGPSGCGKSTTLRMIAGLEEISAGEVLIDERVINRVAPKDRDVAMVFQNYALYPHLNVAENIGGQRQRVAMGRAIVRHPKVFLFDEPLSNLDAKLRSQMRAEIKRLHKRLDVTSIYVTHDQVEAMTLADRIVVMNNGMIEQVGTPMDLFLNPANIFVAGFIGSPPMNQFKAKLSGSSTSPFAEIANQSLPLPARTE